MGLDMKHGFFKYGFFKPGIWILLLIVLAGLLYWVVSKPQYPLTQEDAKKFFLEDLKTKYPDADIREVIEIIEMKTKEGENYYQLKARVTYGFYTPCPERLDIQYEYPPKNFVAQPPAYITKGCEICKNQENCIIAFPEEAIIASHKFDGGEKVREFIKENQDAKPMARFESEYKNYTDIWLVKWSSQNKSILAIVSKTGKKVINVEEEIQE